MLHPLSDKYPIPISQLYLVNTDVPAGVGAPPLDTTPCSPSCSQSMCCENQMKSYCVKWLLLEALVSKVETLFVLQ